MARQNTPMSRRRFLAWLGAAGAAVAGATILRGNADSAAPTAGTSSATAPNTSLTTLPPAETSSTTTAPEPTEAPTTTTAPAVALSAICRDAWAASPVAGEFRSHTIERLTVHHTALLLTDNRRAPAAARQHQQYHVSRGWPDLAYHYLIDANGNIYEGRPVDAVGDTGTEYDPTGHFLVCAEGNFDEQEIGTAQLEAMTNVLAWAAGEFGVSPTTIRGHRDWAATTCPGANFHPLIAGGQLEGAVAARLEAGGATLATLCDEAATMRLAAIEAGEA